MSNFDGRITYKIDADTSSIDKSLDHVEDSAQKAGTGVEGAFKKIATSAAVAAAAKAVYAFGKACVDVASDLAEVQNVVDVTFGESASVIESWAKTAGTQFGLTELQAKQFTSTLGAMMKSSGLAGDEIVSMSTDLAGLAADMASFYNLDFETAFNKIRSGISGETEPLKQLGINMSVANLEAYAMTKGITKAFDKMSQGEQTLLRYQYLMSATADAQGDFARTSDGLANATRQLETNMETLKANIGKLLMPAIQEAINLVVSLTNTLVGNDTTKKRTVLDDIADIDLQTEKKIKNINDTKEQALILVGILDDLSGKNAGQALSDMADGADKLKEATVRTWEKLQTPVDNISKISDNPAIGTLAAQIKELKDKDPEAWKAMRDALSGIQSEKTATGVIAQLAGDADSLNGTTVAEWATLKLSSAELANLTDGGTLGKLATDANDLDSGSVVDWSNLQITSAELAKLSTRGGLAEMAQNAKGLKDDDVAPWTDLEQDVSGLVSAGGTDISAQIEKVRDAWTNGIDEDGLKQLERLSEAAKSLREKGTGNTEQQPFAGLTGESADEMTRMQRIADALGLSIGGAVSAQDLWIETCRQLVKTIPGLSSIINTETGEIEGGTTAVYDYITAWEKAQKAQVYWDAHRRKGEAINKEYESVVQDEITYERLKRERNRASREFEDLGGLTAYEEGRRQLLERHQYDNDGGLGYSLDAQDFENSPLAQSYKKLQSLTKEVDEAEKNLAGRSAARKQAIEEWEEEADIITEMVGAESAYADATDDAANSTVAMTEKIASAKEALQDLADYMENAREATIRTLDGVARGFEEIVTPAQQAQREMQNAEDLFKAGKITQEQKESTIVGETGKKKTVQGMARGLESQLNYFQEYNRLVEEARANGASEELLAALSDGSQESFDYLTALAEGTSEEVQALSEQYAEVNKNKESLADTLTANKLAVDTHYQELVQTAENAVKALDMAGGAKQASATTVQGIIDGLASKYPALVSQVDAIVAQMARLSSFGWFSFDLPTVTGNGGGYTDGGGRSIQPFAIGLDYVPFNGFLASLHEGEAILTAEENRAWQMFKNGGASSANSIDYGRLSGAIWDNAPRMGGGNVYLDGQSVGRVISAQQADSLRQLQRSGWQA